ncbi:MAG TPA: hypothetical protein PLV21_18695 [Cyclobacteriaceae bacterium]|nr:hypothetical protein [Cyclobacteriaceae bacterium]HRJ83922.1 hypothetical protein [Cyclobacteriaceae bacterium]
MRASVSLLFLIISVGVAVAQGEDNSLKGVPFKERIVTGGGFGLGFGNVQDFVSLSPVIGYSVTRKFLVGSGFTYRYSKYKLVTPATSFNDYSINPFARFTVYKGFFVQTEFEHLNYQLLVGPGEKERRSFNSFLAGAGLLQPIGNKASFFIMALYNFSYTPSDAFYTPYQSPWVIRAGVNIGGFIF